MPSCEKCDAESELTEGLCKTCEEADNVEPLSQSRKATPCPCGNGPTVIKMLMQCTACEIWWHPSCVGLAGLNYYGTTKLIEWKCPACFVLDKSISEKLGLTCMSETNTDESLRKTVKDEMKAIMPEVVEEIKAGVKLAFEEDSMKQIVNGAKEAISKSWADIAKTEQKRVMKEVVEKTSDSALQTSLGRISADLSEQKNRSRNCVVSNIPEGYGGPDSTLIEVVANFAELETSDIADCKRLGKKETGTNRIILVRFKKEDVAAGFHNYGRGRHLGNNKWVNPDLTRTEREAKYRMRKEKEKKKKEEQPPVRGTGGLPAHRAEPAAAVEPAPTGEQENAGSNTRTRRPSARTSAQLN